MKFNLADMIIHILALGLFMSPIILMGLMFTGLDAFSCSQKAKALEFKSEYSIFTGCVVTKSDGTKILLEQLRNID